jgi:hypothetical protein
LTIKLLLITDPTEASGRVHRSHRPGVATLADDLVALGSAEVASFLSSPLLSSPLLCPLLQWTRTQRTNQDTRTPEELLDLIEAKGREAAEALAALRGG